MTIIGKYFRSQSTQGPQPRLQKKAALIVAIALAPFGLKAQAELVDRDRLLDLSLEELASISVISVSKTKKPISEAPASIFVITERDIRSSGATTLPEALRLAPNLQVARIDARNYAVTARGFNNPFANKLLVMVDGRTIYSPLFSGVYWDAQDIMLEDLDRVEVVSGAGGTLWGANAVNGVVNIVSRSAADTQGGLVALGGSANEQQASARYGGKLSGTGHYRVYAKHSQHDDTFTEQGVSTQTGWERDQTGFRMDWGSGNDATTVQGDAYEGRLRQAGTADIDISGANILARKGWQLSNDSSISLQGYIDHTQRDQPRAFAQHMNTIDIEVQHQLSPGDHHNIVWGAGYRYVNDHIVNEQGFAFLPDDISMTWKNIFAQDEITLNDSIKLTLGSKWEENPYTGSEFMPGAQLAWSLNSTSLAWASVSRAVRSPSRIDRDLYSPTTPPVVNGVAQYLFAGGPDFVSEVVDVLELGYRSQPLTQLSWSITAFYSEYDKLRTLEFNRKGSGLVFENMAEATTHGVEAWSSWQARPNLRLHAGVVAQQFDVTTKPGSDDLARTSSLANADPNVYWSLRSSYSFSSAINLDATLRHVDDLGTADVPAYTSLDLRAGWIIAPATEISLVGQNLLESTHVEFGTAPGRSEYERSVFAKLVWGF